MGVLDWLESLPLSEWVATSEAGYPAMLSLHSIGMSAVVGLLLMLDFRVLGFGRGIPYSIYKKFMPYAWAGFALNLISGVLLFNSTANRLMINWPFLTKMGAIVLAGGITWLLWRSIKSQDEVGADGTAAASRGAKLLAVVSIFLWFVAIVCGRLIAYVMDYQILNSHR